jgi:hypothetical protein
MISKKGTEGSRLEDRGIDFKLEIRSEQPSSLKWNMKLEMCGGVGGRGGTLCGRRESSAQARASSQSRLGSGRT